MQPPSLRGAMITSVSGCGAQPTVRGALGRSQGYANPKQAAPVLKDRGKERKSQRMLELQVSGMDEEF